MPTSAGGRPPKADGQIRHRNPVTKDTIHLAHDARAEVVPDPTLPLTPTAMKVWEILWRSPLATLWCEADASVLTRLVTLQTKRTWTPAVLAELRQIEDRYLLNPYARIQQRVVIGGAVESAEDGDGVAWLQDAKRRLRGTG